MKNFLEEYDHIISSFFAKNNCDPMEIAKALYDKLYHKEFNKYLRYGHYPRIDEIKKIVRAIYQLENNFNFFEEVRNGNSLFIGEGNFSFSLSIAKEIPNPQNIIATELQTELSNFSKDNIIELESLGATILTDIDATKIHEYFAGYRFSNIIFQFPHTGTREPVEGRNSNFILLRDFLKSAKNLLSYDGKVIISMINSSYYEGIFQIDEASKITGYNKIEAHEFNPLLFKDYVHIMTNEDDSPIEKDDELITIIFKE